MVAIGEVYLNYSHIPAVNIRGAADYVTPPLRRRKDGTWEERSEFTERLNGGDAMTTEGYRYAIKTTSMYTINLFRVRKLAKDHTQGGGYLPTAGGGGGLRLRLRLRLRRRRRPPRRRPRERRPKGRGEAERRARRLLRRGEHEDEARTTKRGAAASSY